MRMDASEWFLVNVGLRQGCVMSPFLFNVDKDGVGRKVNASVFVKGLYIPLNIRNSYTIVTFKNHI